MENDIKYSFLIIVSTLSWGVTFPLIKISLEYMSPVIFLSVRFGISALIMIPFIPRPLNLSGLREGMIAGFFLFMGYYFQTVGLYYTTPAISGLITGLYVVLVPIISFVFLKVRVARSDWLAVLIAVAGLVIITGGQLSNASVQFGDILTLICAVGYALQMIYVARHSHVETVKFTFFQMLAVFLFSTLLIPSFGIYANLTIPIVLFSVLFTAVFAGVIAYFLVNRALVFVKPEKAGIIMVSEPIFAALFSVIITGVPLSYYTIAGGSLMVIAMFWTVYDQYAKKKRAISYSSHDDL
ncbi:MAG: DMT family transporter [Candidatus Thermoplasmatota archaeon]|nr:DMT family transporter [Candidatus Thermoplasmatota archaeon]MCL5790938.1 DMT family transporter [Candidatus Thermoplasmatota archaeon]